MTQNKHFHSKKRETKAYKSMWENTKFCSSMSSLWDCDLDFNSLGSLEHPALLPATCETSLLGWLYSVPATFFCEHPMVLGFPLSLGPLLSFTQWLPLPESPTLLHAACSQWLSGIMEQDTMTSSAVDLSCFQNQNHTDNANKFCCQLKIHLGTLGPR